MNAFRIVIAIIALAVSPFGLCGGGVSHPGKVSIETTYVVPDVGLSYCRTCCHLKSGTFSAVQLEVPTPKTEWRLCKDEPKYKWEIDPKPAGTVRGETTSTLFVDLAERDFPKSFVVSVVVSWRVEREDGSESEVVTAKAEMDFDAIKYVCSIRPVEDVDDRSECELVDGYAGECVIDPKGCTKEALLNLLLSAKATPGGQNEVKSTAMPAIATGSVLKWNLPTPRWYAINGVPPCCCYTNSAEYLFTLKVDGCELHNMPVKVYLPTEDLGKATISATSAKLNVSKFSRDPVSGHVTMEIKIDDFVVESVACSSAKSQYKDKIMKEELIHKNQYMRVVNYGFEDAFSLSAVLKPFNVETCASGTVFEKTFENIEAAKDFLNKLERAIDFEMAVSGMYFDRNKAYIEYEAKRLAEYREAYLYHCCYEKSLGSVHGKIEKSQIQRSLR